MLAAMAQGGPTLATWLGLPHALWAAMSALIVSQAHLHETHSSFQGRILGTLLGLGVAVLVGEGAAQIAAPVGLQIALAVAICALEPDGFRSI